MLDASEVERRTGWPVVSLDVADSTNDEAARRLPADPAARLAVVAARQTSGRGRGGTRFASPPGGLYASLAFHAPSDDVPAPLVAATALAVARAVERLAHARTQVKWPNDVWIEGRKVAGILVEAAMGGRGGGEREDEAASSTLVRAVVGIGVNVAAVPDDLPPEVASATTALDRHASAPVRLEDLLAEVLVRIDDYRRALRDPAGLARVEAEYRARAALLGRRVRYRAGESEESGVLRDLSLSRGLAIESGAGHVVWRPMALVRSLRAESGPQGPPVIPS